MISNIRLKCQMQNKTTLESWQLRWHSQPDGRPKFCSFDCGSSIYRSFFNFSFSDCLRLPTQCFRCDQSYGRKEHCSWDSVAAIEFSDSDFAVKHFIWSFSVQIRRNGNISTSGPKFVVTVVLSNIKFLQRIEILAIYNAALQLR